MGTISYYWTYYQLLNVGLLAYIGIVPRMGIKIAQAQSGDIIWLLPYSILNIAKTPLKLWCPNSKSMAFKPVFVVSKYAVLAQSAKGCFAQS